MNAPFKRQSVRIRLDREKLIELWKTDKSLDQIAALLKVSRFTCSRAASEIGLQPRTITRVRIDVDKLRQMVAGGLTLQKIADAFDCSDKSVVRAMAKHGISRPKVQHQDEAPRAAPQKPQIAASDLTGRLIATKGRWSALAKIADEQRWTSAQAQQRYHAARSEMRAQG